MRLRFSMAWPAAPLTRLSMVETITVLLPEVAMPRWHPFVFTTPWRATILGYDVLKDAVEVRKTPFRKESHKPGVRVPVGQDGSRGITTGRLEHDRRQDSTCDGNQRRGKNEVSCGRARQTSQHFRSMTVLQDTIGLQVLIHFAEVRFLFGVSARPGNAGLAIRHNQRIFADRSRCLKRSQRHYDGSGIATRVGDQFRVTNFVSKDLSETINGFR